MYTILDYVWIIITLFLEVADYILRSTLKGLENNVEEIHTFHTSLSLKPGTNSHSS